MYLVGVECASGPGGLWWHLVWFGVLVIVADGRRVHKIALTLMLSARTRIVMSSRMLCRGASSQVATINFTKNGDSGAAVAERSAGIACTQFR